MELKDFIQSTFEEIVGGINGARSSRKPAAGVAQNNGFKINDLPSGILQDHVGRLYTVVDFDVAVTSGSEIKGETGILVFPFKLGGSAGSENSTVSRVKFSIPMRLVLDTSG